MARIVMKFGGTSMAGIERIRSVAARVKREAAAGNQVAVVVSAMAGETDRLVGFCREASPLYDPREYDVVVAAGEQVTSGLLAIALQAIGVPARSWLGWQLPIHTDDAFAKARIGTIDTDALDASLSAGEVAVIPGFQGVSANGRITTLGRGGSDTSAVAVAAAMKADRCDIYTDVDGVYTTDPRIVPRARKLAKVTYEEMLELASVGAKVLQTRSVGLAMKENVRIQVLSSFTGDDAPMADTLPGTMIVGEEEAASKENGDVERQLITGIAHDKNEAKITLTSVPDKPGSVAAIFEPLAAANINVDMIIQNIAHRSAGSGDNGSTSATDVTFTVPAADLPRSIEALNQARGTIGFGDLIHDTRVAKISVVGVGMRSHAGVASTMFTTLGARGINIQAISTSEIKVSVLIHEDETELAVRVLHTAYGLDADEAA
ncbi:aspartate kinase [Sphingomonas sp. Leaf231]|uniref:aspartate kinase n=1 Tax=Sphingomonas sp. Leaf231 TaxID=1736301 RepID=UPI0006FAF391|nr:aspartate kinase [Sphingomonas sp. Leaf231]KQN92621.1 aspartate kinase [Sphingomonas sp. Leaf231]